AQPSVSIDDQTVTEGNGTTPNVVFNVALSAASGQAVTVNYTTADGTTNPATAGNDYLSITGSLTFNPGETNKTITVVVTGDFIDEPDETFFVNLTSATNATIADGQGLGTIIDDDNPPSVSISGSSVIEGDSGSRPNLPFTINLSSASGK